MREKTPPAYTSVQRRSAYHAEFARLWKPGEPKKVLAGAGHAPEIEYFWANGVKDSRITDIAAAHIELLAQHYDEFMSFVDRSEHTLKGQETWAEFVGYLAGIPIFPIMLAWHLTSTSSDFPSLQRS